jgi:ElaB/YqjD/DUF883 family membrane-anchored ribosome-binding protein
MDSAQNHNSGNQNTQTTIGEQAHAVVDTIKEQGQALAGTLKEQGQEKVQEYAGQLRENVQSSLDQTKGRAADGLATVSQGLHEVCHKLNEGGNTQIGGYFHQGHQAVDQFSDYLRNRQVNEIFADVEEYARQKPAMFVGSLFAVGFLAGRFFRSSAPSIPRSRALVPYEAPKNYDPRANSDGRSTPHPSSVRREQQPSWR